MNLPNGSQIPVGGLGSLPVINLPIGNTGARVYFAVGKGAAGEQIALFGTAITFKEFDSLAKYVGNANLFPAFVFPDGIRGIAGIFTGTAPSTSGIAVFVDVGPVLPKNMQTQTSPRTLAMSADSIDSAPRAAWPVGQSLLFKDVHQTRSQERKIRSELYYMNQQAQRLSIE